MASSPQEQFVSVALNPEQEAAFRVWVDFHDGTERPSLQAANEYLQQKYSRSFSEVHIGRIMDEIYSKRSAAAAAESKPAQDTGPADNSRCKFPGFGLPISFLPANDEHFPILVGDRDKGWKAATLLIRELCMLKVVEDLTNKPEWWRKVRDADTSAKWKKEILAVDWPEYHRYADFTPKMADACIEELNKKATLYEATGLIPVFDYSACVVKSDRLMDQELTEQLVDAVRPLEDVPEHQKDWHPGSNGTVLDLVHPSLWPLIYGRSRILPDKEITVDNCLNHVGLGEVIAKPEFEENVGSRNWMSEAVSVCSVNYQWLPCNVLIDDDGEAKINSYINNLHPVDHAGLYSIIEKFITRSLPAWDLVYRWPRELEFQRLTTSQAEVECTTPEICERRYECRPTNRPINDDEPPRPENEEEEGYEEDEADYEDSERGQLDALWFQATHPQILPDATLDSDAGEEEEAVRGDTTDECEGARKEQKRFGITPDTIKTSGFLGSARRLQVIVKLANIHLTPSKPSYEGGSWHIEGQRNEHICATALFYYDNDNITESRLAFRTSANSEDLTANLDYLQSDVRSIARTFAVDEALEATTLQDMGSVLTRQGRAVFFPNLVQHQVRPFSLRDAARPGHRKILALFLVDPAIPVISTANVPPQQRHWWPAEDHIRRGNRLPLELANMVLNNVDYVMGEEEARQVRKSLMSERTVLRDIMSEALQSVEFSFCEH